MHIRAFGLRATIVLRDEFLSWKVLRDAKSMGTAALIRSLYAYWSRNLYAAMYTRASDFECLM